jgi:uncharacterized protein YjbI with pentapeptide repeats
MSLLAGALFAVALAASPAPVASPSPAASTSPAAAPAALPKFCQGCSFAGAQLSNSDFSNALLVATDFENSTLDGVTFNGARLIAANFQNSDLRGAHFDSADCIACNFQGARLDGATFANVRLTAANFAAFISPIDNAALRQLLGGCLSCNFRAALLSGQDLSGLSLIGVDFSSADLRRVNFTGAVLCWYGGNGMARKPVCDDMHDAQTTGAKFANVQLCENPLVRSGCTPVPPNTLRQYMGPKLGLTGP